MTLCSTISLSAHDCNDAYGSMKPLVKCLNVDSIVLFENHAPSNSEKSFFKHGFHASNTNFLARRFVYPLAQRKAKNLSVDCYKEQKLSNIKPFLLSYL